MAGKKESILTVPAELVRKSSGIGFDLGSSALKFVYRTKEDLEEVSTEGSKYGHLRLVLFSRGSLDEALEYVRERADVTRTGQDPSDVYSTGVGGTHHGKMICEKLNIKTHQLAEMDCIGKSFFHLASRLPRTEFLEPFIEEATEEPLAAVAAQIAIFQGVKLIDQPIVDNQIDPAVFMQGIQMAVGRPSAAALEAGDVPLAEAEPDMFPGLVVLAGSGFGCFRVDKDGSFKLTDLSSRGGKTFLGLGTLLTGCKSFDELVELASKGSQQSLDVFNNELLDTSGSAEDTENIYMHMISGPPMLVFCFGKAVDSDISKFKREDLARSWLNHVVLDLVQCVQHCCQIQGVGRVFFVGGFCDHPFVRHLITKEFVSRSLMQFALGARVTPIQFDFVKPGAHLGALGCLVNDVEKFLA